MKETEKAICGEIEIDASLEEAWAAWTTEEGIKSFLAPDCKIDLQPDGLYEIYFDPEAPYGKRGGEGLRVMALQTHKMLSFTWNAPPSLPDVRNQRTHVVIRFFPSGNKTRVTLFHSGWGSGGQWDEAYEYFQRAWNAIVLPRLAYRFRNGSVDWDNPPDVSILADKS